MATSGSPWICEKDTIVKAIKKNNGKLTHAAKDLEVAYYTLKKRIDADSELQELVEGLRNSFVNTLLDTAEDCVLSAMENQDTDPNNAIKSAFFVLNSRGQERDWSNTNAGSGNLYIVRQDPTKRDQDQDTTQIPV